MNPEVPPPDWTDYIDPDHDANVDWSILVWSFVIGFAATIGGFVLWGIGKVFLSVIMLP